jgi:hypothetical protein
VSSGRRVQKGEVLGPGRLTGRATGRTCTGA